MRRASIYHTNRNFMELKMTPLIDVVFLLLVFFVWTASFQIVEYVLPSSVSEAETAASGGGVREVPPPEADFAEVLVRVLSNENGPRWEMNQESLEQLSDVQDRLRRIFSVNREAPVVIAPDAEVPLGDVIDLYDVARLVGFGKVQFAVTSDPAQG